MVRFTYLYYLSIIRFSKYRKKSVTSKLQVPEKLLRVLRCSSYPELVECERCVLHVVIISNRCLLVFARRQYEGFQREKSIFISAHWNLFRGGGRREVHRRMTSKGGRRVVGPGGGRSSRTPDKFSKFFKKSMKNVHFLSKFSRKFGQKFRTF